MGAPEGPTPWFQRDGWAQSAIPIVVITLLGAILRLIEMGQSLSGDELWTYAAATKPDFGAMLDFVRSDEEITPPLYPALAWLSAQAGDATTLIRLPTVIAGIATIPLTWAIGLRTIGVRTALVAATLAALSPFLAFYAVEARAYALAYAFAAASTLCMLYAIDSRKAGWWAGYALTTCAAMYSHYTAAYVLIVQLAWLLWFHRERWKPALIANALAALAFVPWIPGFLDDLDSPTVGTINVLAPFNLDNVVTFTGAWAIGNPANGLKVFWGLGLELVLLAAVAVVLVGLGLRLAGSKTVEREREGETERDDLILIVLLALATPVGVALVSLVGDDLYLPRNIGASWPYWGIALAAGLTAWRPPVRWVLAGVLIALFAVGAYRTTTAHWGRPDAKGAATYLDESFGPDDVVFDAMTLARDSTEPPAVTLDIQFGDPHVVIDANSPANLDSGIERAAGHQLAIVGPPLLTDAIGQYGALAGLQPTTVRTFDGTLPTEVRIYDVPAAGSNSGG